MRTSILAAAFGLLLVPATATAAGPAAQSRAAWKRVAPATFTLDQDALADVLRRAPAEGQGAVRELTHLGPGARRRLRALRRRRIAGAGAGAGGRASGDQDVHGAGLDDPSASARLDLTPLGFHASVRSASGAWYVDPRDGEHVAYRRTAVAARPFEEPGVASRFTRPVAPRAAAAGGDPVVLRVYRLALLSDPDYATGTPGSTTAAKAVLVNRLDQIYEQDLAIRMVLVARNDELNLDDDAEGHRAERPVRRGRLLHRPAAGHLRPGTRSIAPTPSPAGSSAPGELRPRAPGPRRVTAAASRVWAWSARASRAVPARRA